MLIVTVALVVIYWHLSLSTNSTIRSKMTQADNILGMKVDLTAQQEYIGDLHQRNKDLKSKVKTAAGKNGSLQIEVQKEQLKLKALKNEIKNEKMKEQKLAAEYNALKSGLNKAHELKDKVPTLKKHLIELSRSLSTPKNVACRIIQCETSDHFSRECDTLRRKVKSLEDISKRSTKLHNLKMLKLKQESQILHKVCNF